jgi:hypothetical protein
MRRGTIYNWGVPACHTLSDDLVPWLNQCLKHRIEEVPNG